MRVTGFKAAIVGAVVIASVAAPLAVQHSAQAKWRERNELLEQQAGRLAELSTENQRLSSLVAQAESSSLPSEQLRELLRLRGELGRLRQSMSEIAKLREANQQFLAGRTNPAERSGAPAPPEPQTVRAYWPKTQLALAGYADPGAALQTALWAMSRGDATALVASLTPEARSKLAREQDWLQHGTPGEELAAAARNIADSLNPCSGFYVVGQNFVSQDQAILDLYFEGEGKTRKAELKKIGDGWRFDNLGNGVWP